MGPIIASGMPMRISAYLSIFDDWDFLPHALAAVSPYVDEIVVVDGAYRWMAPMLRASGRDPQKSLPEVYACFEAYSHKLRIISGLWEDELQKRSAGYAACEGRYVLRFDADEITYLTAERIETTIARGFAVASVELPTFALPGWINASLHDDGSVGDIERQCVFFDRDRIGPEDHLTYLWLVLGDDEKTRLGQLDPANIDPIPLAFSAHLTSWRTPRTSIHRARFYFMNWMRDLDTVPWLGGIVSQVEDGFSAFFQAIPPDAFASLLLGHEIAAGQPSFGQWAVRRAPADAIFDPTISDRFLRLLKSLANLNQDLATGGRMMLSGMPCCIDLSSANALAALSPRSGNIAFEFDKPISSCNAKLLTLAPGKDDTLGHGIVTKLAVTIEDSNVIVTIPEHTSAPSAAPFRRTLVIEVCADWAVPIYLVSVGKFPPISVASLLEQGRLASAAFEWHLAVDLWRQIHVEDPVSEEANLRLGEALIGLRQSSEAEVFCSQAWLDYPGNLWIGRNWALVAMQQRKWEESIHRFRDVCSRHMHDALQADLGECLLFLERHDEAAIVVSSALEQFPQSIWLQRLSARLGGPVTS